MKLTKDVVSLILRWYNQQWNLTIVYEADVEFPKFGRCVYRNSDTLFLAEEGDFVNFFSWAPGYEDRRPRGGIRYDSIMLDTEVVIGPIDGAWSSNSRAVKKAFGVDCVDISIASFDMDLRKQDTFGAHVTKDAVNELFKSCGVSHMFECSTVIYPPSKYVGTEAERTWTEIVGKMNFEDMPVKVINNYPTVEIGLHFTGCSIPKSMEMKAVHRHADGTYWFYDECWHMEHGPYETFQEACDGLSIYMMAPEVCPDCGQESFSFDHKTGELACCGSDGCTWKFNVAEECCGAPNSLCAPVGSDVVPPIEDQADILNNLDELSEDHANDRPGREYDNLNGLEEGVDVSDEFDDLVPTVEDMKFYRYISDTDAAVIICAECRDHGFIHDLNSELGELDQYVYLCVANERPVACSACRNEL